MSDLEEIPSYYDIYRHIPEWSPDSDIQGVYCDAKQIEQIRILQRSNELESQVKKWTCCRRNKSGIAIRNPSDQWQLSVSPGSDKVAVLQGTFFAVFQTQPPQIDPLFATNLSISGCTVHFSPFFLPRPFAWAPCSRLIAVLEKDVISIIDLEQQVTERIHIKEKASSKCQQVVALAFRNTVSPYHLFVLKMDGSLSTFDVFKTSQEHLKQPDSVRRRAERPSSLDADEALSRISLHESGSRKKRCAYLAMSLNDEGHLAVAFVDRLMQVSISLWNVFDAPPFVECVARGEISSPSLRQRVWTKLATWAGAASDVPHFSVACKLRWSPDGSKLALVTPAGALEVWSCNLQALNKSISLASDDLILDVAWWNKRTVGYVSGESVVLASLDLAESRFRENAQELFHGRPLLADFRRNNRTGLYILETDIRYLKCESEEGNAVYEKRFCGLFSMWQLTPWESMLREVQAGRYDQALNLAQKHSLDTDVVYKHMWRFCEVSSPLFLQYASNINDTAWLLQACMNKIDDSLSNACIVVDLALSRTADRNSNEAVSLMDYRLKFLRYKDRISTLGVYVYKATDSTYTPSPISFLKCSLVEVASQFAMRGDVDFLTLIFDYHSQEVRPSWLQIVSQIPCVTDPKLYKNILPASNLKNKTWRATDWAEDLVSSKAPAPRWVDFDSEELTRWYLNRTRRMDSDSGQLQHAHDLLTIGTKKGISGLSELLAIVQQLSLIAYGQEQWNMRLADYEKLDDFARVCVLLSQSTADTIVQDLKEKSDLLKAWKPPAFPKLEQKVPSNESPESRRASLIRSLVGEDDHPLHRYLVFIARDKIEVVAAVIKHGRDTDSGSGRLITGEEALIRVSLACVYACDISGPRVWRSTSEIYESLPQDCQFLSERVGIFCRHLEAAEIMSQYGVHRPLHSFLSVPIEAKSDEFWCLEDVTVSAHTQRDAERTIQAIYRNVGHTKFLSDITQWEQFKEDIDRLRGLVFQFVSEQFCEMSLCGSLLLAERFDLVMPLTGLSAGNAITMVFATVRSLFNSATDASHPYLERAKQCLLLLPSNPTFNRAIQVELNLIDALESFSSLGLDIIPFKLRQQPDRLEFIKQLVTSNPSEFATASNKTELLEELANLLGHTSSMEKFAAKMMLAQVALEHGDSKWAHRACFSIMEDKFRGGAVLCEEVADTFNTQKAKQQLLAHCIWASEVEDLDRVLEKWKRTVLGSSSPPQVSNKLQVKDCSLVEEVVGEWLNQTPDASVCLDLPALVHHHAPHLEQTLREVTISLVSQPASALSCLFSLQNPDFSDLKETLSPVHKAQLNELSSHFFSTLAFAQTASESPKFDWFAFLAFASSFPLAARISPSSLASHFANLAKSQNHSSDLDGKIDSASSFLRLVSEAKSVEAALCWNHELDVDRFQLDQIYREQQFVKLGETTSSEHLENALSICLRYDLPTWDLYFSHVKWCILQTPSLDPQESCLAALLQEPERFLLCLGESTFTAINGDNLASLLRLYQIACLCLRNTDTANNATLYVQVLEELLKEKATINFKNLVDASLSSREIELRINKMNIMLYLKLSKRLCQILTNPPLFGKGSERGPLPSSSLISFFFLKASLVKCPAEHIAVWFKNNKALLTRLSRQHYCSLFLKFLDYRVQSWTLRQCCDVLERALSLLPSKTPSSCSSSSIPLSSPTLSVSDDAMVDQLVEARACIGVMAGLEALGPQLVLRIEPLSLAALRNVLQDLCASGYHEEKRHFAAAELSVCLQLVRTELLSVAARMSAGNDDSWSMEAFLSDCIDAALKSLSADFLQKDEQRRNVHRLNGFVIHFIPSLSQDEQRRIMSKVGEYFRRIDSAPDVLEAQIAVVQLCQTLWREKFQWLADETSHCLPVLLSARINLERGQEFPAIHLESKSERVADFKTTLTLVNKDNFPLAIKELRAWADLVASTPAQCPSELWECCCLLLGRALVLAPQASPFSVLDSFSLAAEDRFIAVHVLLQAGNLSGLLSHPLLPIFCAPLSAAIARNLMFRVAVQHTLRTLRPSLCTVCLSLSERTGPTLSELLCSLVARRYYAHAMALLCDVLGLSPQLSASPLLLKQYLLRARVHPSLQSVVSHALELLDPHQ